MVTEAHRFLCERAHLGRLTTYTEFCAVVGHRGAGAFPDVGTFALTALLLEVGNAALAETKGALLTCLVTKLDSNSPSDGFFAWAQRRGMLPPGELTPMARDAFWVKQVGQIYNAYDGKPPGPFLVRPG